MGILPLVPNITTPSSNRPRPVLHTLMTAMAIAWLSTPAIAQLVPDRLYYGVNRRIPMSVTLPPERASIQASDQIFIRLFAPDGTQPTPPAPAAIGRVDLASLFPVLWTDQNPRLLYAQLDVAGVPIGPPVVLQPMLTPNYAHLTNPATLQPTFDPAVGRPIFEDFRLRVLVEQGLAESAQRQVTYSGLRAYPEAHVLLDTTLGEIELRLRPDHAPNSAFIFRHLVEHGFYTDVAFHRIVERLQTGHRFVIQVGDPSGIGTGGPGFMHDLEPSTLPHRFGVLSMARSTDPNSNGSQVFICLSRLGTQHLDGAYTAFGEAVAGADVILAISKVQVDVNDRPLDPPIIRRAVLKPAPPFQDRPDPVAEPVEIDGGR